MDKTTPYAMPFLVLGNRLSEIRDRVRTSSIGTSHTLELLDDAIKAKEDAQAALKALVEASKKAGQLLGEIANSNSKHSDEAMAVLSFVVNALALVNHLPDAGKKVEGQPILKSHGEEK